ncbi:MAG: prepilin-type N-terminal cleavage/methylation domain-containing protein [Gammaproteobacteria bacterium]|nr:prepilin-type N-terminal cleavage/methylation domain-containing protein [Gammaproteobacteria bacterium]MBV9697500.1 prepilin-type N-terminal cleavage/methylation domain-containing protein [Gammaproteobacteria bacterium]
MTRRTRAATSGFTLIELLVVMAIIGTLLSIAVPRYFRSLEHARETVLKQDLSILREAIDKYYADLNVYPETLAVLADKRYIRAVPVDPFTKTADSWTLLASEDPDHPGVRDVHSGAADVTASDGTAVAAW